MKQKYSTSELKDFIRRYIEDLENPGKLYPAKIATHCKRKYAGAFELKPHDFHNNQEVSKLIRDYNEHLKARFIAEIGLDNHLLESTYDIDAIMRKCSNRNETRKQIIAICEEVERLREQNNGLLKEIKLLQVKIHELELMLNVEKAAVESRDRENNKILEQNKLLKGRVDELTVLQRKYIMYIEDNQLYKVMIDHFIQIGLIVPGKEYKGLSPLDEKLRVGTNTELYPMMRDFILKYESVPIEDLDDMGTEPLDDTEEVAVILPGEVIDFKKKWLERFGLDGE